MPGRFLASHFLSCFIRMMRETQSLPIAFIPKIIWRGPDHNHVIELSGKGYDSIFVAFCTKGIFEKEGFSGFLVFTCSPFGTIVVPHSTHT